jgi:1,6-anhydro-N-acetylmuramate kinase
LKPLQLALSLIPVAIIAIGLIGWVVTLRGNIDAALADIEELYESQYDDSDIVTQVQDLAIQAEESLTKVMWVMEEYGPAIESIRDRELDTEMADKVADVVTRQAVVENEMRQIMSDHSGFADVLRELGESGLITERRQYGNYGK